jgi:hypothetical protein
MGRVFLARDPSASATSRVLGEGGMGRVFLARDRLERDVAIKFVRGDDPELARRVVAEARAQARVNDERVCKVYEVGEIAGRVYIAMQYVDGKPLNELVGELTYEQKALVMRGAALGVHEAHRAGLIHRDLKPSNIMVERGADGALRPFVMDFGIARDWNDSTTATGTVLGTPQFMAPEQARGEIKQLDRRADVYSLGATLYALLVDRRRSTATTRWWCSTGSRSTSRRGRARSIATAGRSRGDRDEVPREGSRPRYDSARALADDLGRFLDGAPVLARPRPGLGYRLRKTVRRHWRPLLVAIAMVATVAIAVGYGWRERAAAGQRAALARKFTERVERIEALARYAALAPPHDLAPDRAQIRGLMADLTAEIRAGGALAEGPGRYALGRGYLALGDDARALTELETAWARGFREPRAAYALAITEGKLYQRALRDLALAPPAVRERRRPEIERRYRDPARVHLLASRGAEVASEGYVAALLAYYDSRYDDALRELDEITAQGATRSWFYEVAQLRGQVLAARALAPRTAATPDEIDAQLRTARDALAAAAAIGESDPELFLALADIEYRALGLEVYGRGRVDEPYRRGRAATDRVLILEPGNVDALVLRVNLARAMAEYHSRRGEDGAPLLAEAIADARRARTLAPERIDATAALAACLRQAAEAKSQRSQDPAAELVEAIALIEAIPADARDDWSYIQLGLSHKLLADAIDEAGGDASAHRQAAIAAYREVLTRNPNFGEAWLNLGINYVERARHAAATMASTDDLGSAIEALERGRALRPQSWVPDFYEGDAYALRADLAAARGADPDPDRERAIAQYRHGLTLSPDNPILFNGVSIVEAQRAEAAIARGADPTAMLDRAEAAARESIAAGPELGHGQNNLAETFRLRATHAAKVGTDPRPMAERARRALADAIARLPDNPDLVRNQARIELLVAAWEAPRGGGTAAVDRARAAVARAQVLDPDDAETRALSAELAALTAPADR